MPTDRGPFDVAVGRAHYGLNPMTTCFDVDQAKHQAAEMACQLLAQICAEADENREKSR